MHHYSPSLLPLSLESTVILIPATREAQVLPQEASSHYVLPGLLLETRCWRSAASLLAPRQAALVRVPAEVILLPCSDTHSVIFPQLSLLGRGNFLTDRSSCTKAKPAFPWQPWETTAPTVLRSAAARARLCPQSYVLARDHGQEVPCSQHARALHCIRCCVVGARYLWSPRYFTGGTESGKHHVLAHTAASIASHGLPCTWAAGSVCCD